MEIEPTGRDIEMAVRLPFVEGGELEIEKYSGHLDPREESLRQYDREKVRLPRLCKETKEVHQWPPKSNVSSAHV